MSKIKLTGSNSGYVEIDSAADAGNLTLTLPTSGVRLLSNTDNVFSGITTTGELDINGKIDVSTDIVGGRNLKVTGITTHTGTTILNDDVTLTGASYNVLWDKSDNQLEFGDNAKISFGGSSDLQLYHNGSDSFVAETGTGQLKISGSAGVHIMKHDHVEYMASFYHDSDVQLFFNNNLKFKTTNTGAIVTGICTATSFSGSGENLTRTTQLSHRNVVINGDMRIAQRATSHGSSGYRTIDRFKMTAGGASHALTQAQVDVSSGTSPYVRGFRKAYSITNSGQNANNQGYVYMLYEIEAQDIATSGWRYMYNSGGDDYITVSFWVKASVAQTYLFFIHTGDGTTKEWNHLISLSANAWTKITLPIPGNSGITINNDTGVGLRLYWCAYLGDHYTSGGTVDQWVTHSGYTSRPDMGAGWWTTSNATLQLTGVQLEVGEQATPFEHRSIGEQLQRCRRYYQVLVDQAGGSSQKSFAIACAYSSSSMHSTHLLSPEMRTVPTLDYTTGTDYYRAFYNNTADYFNDFNLVGNSHANAVDLAVFSNLSVTQGNAVLIRTTNDASKIAFTAEF